MSLKLRKVGVIGGAGALHTRAMFVPSSLNDDQRTIDVTFVTENPVRTFDWNSWQYIDEVLSLEDGHVRTERLESGAPLLDNHYRGGASSVLGVVENFRFVSEEGQRKGVATVRFSKREEADTVYQDVKDGILRGISVGYRVHKYEEMNPKRTKDELPKLRAIDWEPFEISIAPVQADSKSNVRSEGTTPHDIELVRSEQESTIVQPNQSNIMKREQVIALLQKRGIAFDANATDEQLIEIMERELGKTTTPAPTVDPAKAASDAVAAERKRAAEIRQSVRAAGLGDDVAEKHITDGTTIDAVRAAIIEELGKRQPQISGISVGKEQSEKVREAMGDALLLRSEPTSVLSQDGGENSKRLAAAREFRGMRLMDMARFMLEQAGVNTRGMSYREIAESALNIGQRSYHSSSDFPIILANTVNKTLRAAYEAQARTFMPFCRRVNLADFKAIDRTQLSGLVNGFDEVKEGGEYTASTITEGKESYKLVKYGKKIAITWESLINDDLGAFGRIPQAIAAKAAVKQSDIVYAILLNNPTMADSVALFDAAHGNTSGASAINTGALSTARALMRKQKGLEGDFINVSPSYLIVGPDKETEAQQLINATIVATKTADTNVFRGSLEIIVDPRITGNKWFLAAAPSMVDTIEYAFLDGEPELFTEQRNGFDVDGLEIKARMVFAAKAIDHRGLYYNAGA